MNTFFLRITSLIFLFSCSSWGESAEQIPPEVFGSIPDVQQLSLSPSGEKVVYLARLNKSVDSSAKGGVIVGVMDLKTNEISYPLRSDNESFFIRRVRWAGDESLLVSADFPDVRNGSPTMESRLLTVSIKSGKAKSILTNKFIRKLNWIPQIQDSVVDYLSDEPDSILLALRSESNFPTVYKININKRKPKVVQKSLKNIIKWMADQQGRVRIGIRRKDTTYTILERGVPEKKWRELFEFDAFSEDEVWPLGFGLDPNELYISAYHHGRQAIFKIDLTADPSKKELVLEDKQFDVDGKLIYSKKTREVIGSTYSAHDAYVFWEPEYQKIQRLINRTLPDTSNYIISMSDDEQKFIIYSTSDIDSGSYYFIDIKKKKFSRLAKAYPGLPPEKMSKKLPFSYVARDGLMIHGFLTLPKSYKKDVLLPTIVFPHGGPISYDGSGFDLWTQFFASRGYAVLQMNFRGSSGYGYDFMAAGLKGWGKAMQTDIEDGIKALVSKGIADKDKMCIVGASYGGYAALMGLIQTPDLYRCGISFAGVTDLSYMVRKSRFYTNHEVVKEQIGHNHKALKNVSPVNFAENIKAPVLLIHGEKDRVVRVQHSRKMFKKLLNKEKQVAYEELEGGDHYLSNNNNRMKTFKLIDEFLNAHLQ